MAERLGNYIRMHRKKAALSQRELGVIVGYDHPGPISQHELSQSIPPLIIALSYQVLFRVPVSDLFDGIHEAVENTIEQRIADLEGRLHDKSAHRRGAAIIARKLEWLAERRTSGYK